MVCAVGHWLVMWYSSIAGAAGVEVLWWYQLSSQCPLLTFSFWIRRAPEKQLGIPANFKSWLVYFINRHISPASIFDIKLFWLHQNDISTSFPHDADGLPWPLRIATKFGVHFSESFHPYKDQMSIKKIFTDQFQNYKLSSAAQMGCIGCVAIRKG